MYTTLDGHSKRSAIARLAGRAIGAWETSTLKLDFTDKLGPGHFVAASWTTRTLARLHLWIWFDMHGPQEWHRTHSGVKERGNPNPCNILHMLAGILAKSP